MTLWIADRAQWKKASKAFFVQFEAAKDPYQCAFHAALQRGSVHHRSIKLLSLGAVLAGKTALFAALQGNSLPNLMDRSVATRMKRLRMTFDGRTGLFKSVPQDEFHVASLISVPEESGVTDAAVAQDNNSLTPAPQATRSASPSSSSNPPATRCSPHIRVPTPSLMEKETPTQPHIISATMQTVLTLLKSDLREGHIDLETFDFAGEAMFDSLPALFMGSESLYLIVFDLFAMSDPTTAQRQYEHISKWAHMIMHQVPDTKHSYFKVIIVATHLDTFPNDTAPAALLQRVSDAIFRLVGVVLGNHLMRPSAPTPLAFFAVGSKKRIGLGQLSKAMHDAVRPRTLPMEYVCAQDLIGRRAREKKIALMSRVSDLGSLVLNDDPRITLSSLVLDDSMIRTELVPYLESAADIVVCRENATSQDVRETDTVVFDIPHLIAALELLCSVVMAQWGQASSTRALDMLKKVVEAGRASDLTRTEKILQRLDESRTTSAAGFPLEAAEWLVWTAAKDSEDPLLCGGDVGDVGTFMECLEHLSLARRHGDLLLVPMLLPDDASFSSSASPAPAVLFLYQMISSAAGDWEVLPVSLATFHLVVVALWRACPPDSPIEATQRCTNALAMDGCVPVRLRLSSNERFIRVELLSEAPGRCGATWTKLAETVCESTRTLRWGWRGSAVVVPAHPTDAFRPLFLPESVAKHPERYRDGDVVRAELVRRTGQALVCNLNLHKWWVKRNVPGIYSHVSVLIVGVSRYQSSGNTALQNYNDLRGVRESARLLQDVWKARGCDVESVVDWKKGDRVVRSQIVDAMHQLAMRAGSIAGQESLLIVHLIGHGAEDGAGGLLLSDARATVSGRLSRLTLRNLNTILQEDVFWLGGNALVFCDFCNSGVFIEPDEDLTPSLPTRRTPAVPPAQRGAYARLLITSALKDTKAFTTADRSKTRMTELLVLALGPDRRAFREGEECLTAVELRHRLQELDPANTFQSTLVGRIWKDWTAGMVNSGDIYLYRWGCGVKE